MNLRPELKLATLSLLIALASCQQKESPQQLREQTAEATSQAKSDAKAVAEGIREGWNRSQTVDLNSASREQLENLPGMNATTTDRVIAARPYSAPDELVRRHILSKSEYDKIADRVTAKR